MTSSRKYRGKVYLPYAFTEHGVTMLSCILRSEKAIKMNLAIVRAFIALRKLAITYQELSDKISESENKYNKQFKDVYEVSNLLIGEKQKEITWKKRDRIGFKQKND